MANNRIIGKIIWWNPRDLFGIAQDSMGKRYYLDASCFGKSNYSPKHGDLVTFERNTKVKDCLCATAVEKISSVEKSKSIRRNLDQEVIDG